MSRRGKIRRGLSRLTDAGSGSQAPIERLEIWKVYKSRKPDPSFFGHEHESRGTSSSGSVAHPARGAACGPEHGGSRRSDRAARGFEA